MSTWQALILGILQGLAEFLPISSSGHLLIGEKVLGVNGPGLLLGVLLHVGTLVSVIIVFWKDIWEILSHPVKDMRFRLLVLATIPAVVVAVLFSKQLDALFESGKYLGFSFLATSLILFLGEMMHSARTDKASAEVRTGHAISMGLMQAVAVLPGVSRSGSTITGGIATGLRRESAAKFSFLMSAIAIVGSLVFELKDLIGGSVEHIAPLALLVGVLAALITGYIAIRWMLNLLKTKNMKPFAWYTLAVGILVLIDQVFFGKFFPKFW